MRKLWLIFAQSVTVLLAALFVVATLKPEWLRASGPLSGVQQVITQPLGSGAATPQGGPITVKEATAVAKPVAVLPGHSIGFADAARLAAPAVVNIFTTKQVKPRRNAPADPFFRFFGNPDDRSGGGRQENSLGSGVIVSAQGVVLTNNHVIEGADEIEVALNDGRRTFARVVGSDPETDLAVLRIDLPELTPITLARLEATRVGDSVLAIGNPFGVGQTVTSGIVSALGRSHLGINTFENFIQTDAAINPGNSGGALVDAQGHLLGINTAIFSRDGGSLGIGFAIPVSTAKNVMEQILANGKVVRGYIGVDPRDVGEDFVAKFKLPNTDGVLIDGVLANQPAARAGIRRGDVLVAIDNLPIKDTVGLLNNVASLPPGKETTVRLYREGKLIELPITVGTRPAVKRITQPE
ncbi:S1C family serine protease [Piscinibacterium candidicorallinum]|jgi:serine protease DegQ|uniref:S1C family serine protease n=1 Tax=Piscinibacterium candidicorallinum TaxID=1793872 RepID=A0ABV7H243_9BURK